MGGDARRLRGRQGEGGVTFVGSLGGRGVGGGQEGAMLVGSGGDRAIFSVGDHCVDSFGRHFTLFIC